MCEVMLSRCGFVRCGGLGVEFYWVWDILVGAVWRLPRAHVGCATVAMRVEVSLLLLFPLVLGPPAPCCSGFGAGAAKCTMGALGRSSRVGWCGAGVAVETGV